MSFIVDTGTYLTQDSWFLPLLMNPLKVILKRKAMYCSFRDVFTILRLVALVRFGLLCQGMYRKVGAAITKPV
jgi:hypothetical protein